MRKFTIIFAALLVSACVTISASGDSPDPIDEAALIASDWRFVTIDGAPPADPAKARMSFYDGRASANVGCNGMGGDWSLADGKLITDPWMSTKMYCGGRVGEQERAVSMLIGADPEISISGDTLTLTSASHSATLQRVIAGS